MFGAGDNMPYRDFTGGAGMHRKRSWQLGLMTVALLVAVSGCGRKVGVVVDPGEDPGTPVNPSTPAPNPSPTPGPVTPSPVPVNPLPVADLSARPMPVQTRGLLMSRTVVAEVEVVNPNDVRVAGVLTCKFGDGTASDGTQTRNISMEPREIKTFAFERKTWFGGTAVQASVVTQKPSVAPVNSGFYR